MEKLKRLLKPPSVDEEYRQPLALLASGFAIIFLLFMFNRLLSRQSPVAQAPSSTPTTIPLTKEEGAKERRRESYALSANPSQIVSQTALPAPGGPGQPNLGSAGGPVSVAAPAAGAQASKPLKTTYDTPDFLPPNAMQLKGAQAVLGLSVPARNAASIEKGRQIYKSACLVCHGTDACANTSANFRARTKVSDLRFPRNYRYGSGEKAIFRSISEGTGNLAMPIYKDSQSASDIWCLVFYLQSLGSSVKT